MSKMKTLGNNKVLASSLTFRGSKMFTGSGENMELNAGNKKDALSMLVAATKLMSEGKQLVNDDEAGIIEARVLSAEAVENRKELLAAVMADRTGDTAISVGKEMAGTIYTEVNKIGIMRQLLGYQDLAQGQIPQTELDVKNVTAVVMDGPTQARLQIVRENYLQPPEVDIVARPYIEAKRMNQSRTDLLQKAYNDGLEAILVGEDRMWKVAADLLIDNTGQGTTHVGSAVTPAVLNAGMSQLSGFGFDAQTILIAAGLWTGVMWSTDFGEIIDPVTRLEIMRTGKMGTVMGATLMTDASRSPNQKVLESNEIYYVGAPQNVGEFTDRGGVTSLPITAAETAINGAGWHLVEYVSIALPNFKAIARTRLV